MRFTLVGMTVVVALVAVVVSAWAQPGQPVGQTSQPRPPEGTVPIYPGSVNPGNSIPGAVNPGSIPTGSVEADGSGIIAMSAPVSDKVQQITVIDTRDRVMAVYHVDENGVITLKNVRKIHYDLQMEQFNGTSPLPQEIRAKIEQLR